MSCVCIATELLKRYSGDLNDEKMKFISCFSWNIALNTNRGEVFNYPSTTLFTECVDHQSQDLIQQCLITILNGQQNISYKKDIPNVNQLTQELVGIFKKEELSQYFNPKFYRKCEEYLFTLQQEITFFLFQQMEMEQTKTINFNQKREPPLNIPSPQTTPTKQIKQTKSDRDCEFEKYSTVLQTEFVKLTARFQSLQENVHDLKQTQIAYSNIDKQMNLIKKFKQTRLEITELTTQLLLELDKHVDLIDENKNKRRMFSKTINERLDSLEIIKALLDELNNDYINQSKNQPQQKTTGSADPSQFQQQQKLFQELAQSDQLKIIKSRINWSQLKLQPCCYESKRNNNTVCTIPLRGVKQEDIQCQFTQQQQQILISGEKKATDEELCYILLLIKNQYGNLPEGELLKIVLNQCLGRFGSFNYYVNIPNDVVRKDIQVNYSDETLQIILPHSPPQFSFGQFH
ncbi:hypothetical protein QTN25_001481 [Entamoeba marina]